MGGIYMEKVQRRLAREKAVFCIYQWLLVKPEREELNVYLNSVPELVRDAGTYQYSSDLVNQTIDNEEQLTKELSKYLKKGWTFERLSFLERAILLVCASEILDSDLNEKIVMNEAVEMAKKYCNDDSYRFINGILKQLLG